jgi:tetratricopeptide (TPR) repeat protein
VRAYWAAVRREWPRCIELADRCLEEAPGHSWASYFKGQALEAEGRLPEAVDVWQRVIEEVDPSDDYWDLAVASLGRLGRKLEDATAFESAFARAIEAAPDTPMLWAAMCDCFRYSGRSRDAQQYFESLYQRVTDKVGLALTVGHLLADLRSMPEARAWFERVPPHNAAFPRAVRGVVGTLIEENRLEEALGLLSRTAERAPSAEIYSLLVDARLDAYQFPQAVEWFRRALREFPGTLPDSADRLLYVLHEAGADGEVESLVEFLRRRQEEVVGRARSELLLCAATGLQHLDRPGEALECCDEALAIDAASGPAWITKAEIQFDRGDHGGAVVSARRSCDTRYAPYPFRRLFGFLRDTGRIDEAFDVCIEALAVFPGELGFQELLDGLVIEFQMLDRYLEACGRLFPLVEDKAEFLGNQGTVFWRLGDDERAREFYERALEYGDRNWLHAQLGVVYRNQGEFPAAERELRTALELDPQYDYAAERLADLYADWFFAYEQVAEHLGDDPGLPTRESLLQNITGFYEQVARTQPNNERIFGEYCQFCVRCGDLAPVESLMPRYAETSAVYSAVCCHLADAYVSLHDVDAAQDCLRRAVEADEPEPYKARAYLRMGGHAAAYRHDSDEALAWYRRAIAADPEEVDGYGAVAGILEEQGRIGEALEELLAGLEQVEDPSPLLRPLARTAVQAGRWSAVQEAARECLRQMPAREAAQGWMQVARGLSESFDYEGARAALACAEQTCPLPVAVERTRLQIAAKRRDYDEVESSTGRLLELDPDNLHGLYEKSRLGLRRGDVRSALGFMERMIKAGGEPQEFLTEYAHAAADLGCMPELLGFCNACYTEGHARGVIHLLQILAYHLLDDEEGVGRLLESLAEVDAARVADAEIILADTLVNQWRFAEALPRLSRAIARDPHNPFARSLYVGTSLALGDVEAARPHVSAIVEDPARDHWAIVALCETPVSVWPDLRANTDRFRGFFAPLVAAAEQARDRCAARQVLIDVALRWGLDAEAAEYARQAIDDHPLPDGLPTMHEAAIARGDLDLADRIVAASKALHVHPVTVAQLRSINHAVRGQIDRAVEAAHESRHGHGAEFAEMCTRLFQTGADLGDLCDTLFDCVMRYHEGHGPCTAWALLLLFRHGRAAEFDRGMAEFADSARDYRLALEWRRSVGACLAAVRLYCARAAGDGEQEARTRQEIDAMPFFGRDVGSDLYYLLGFGREGGPMTRPGRPRALNR